MKIDPLDLCNKTETRAVLDNAMEGDIKETGITWNGGRLETVRQEWQEVSTGING